MRKRLMRCDGCNGTGLMEGWDRWDGNSCPICKGSGAQPPPGKHIADLIGDAIIDTVNDIAAELAKRDREIGK